MEKRRDVVTANFYLYPPDDVNSLKENTDSTDEGGDGGDDDDGGVSHADNGHGARARAALRGLR